MPEPTRTSDPVLTALADEFDIVGELAGASHTQYLIATRKSGAGQRREDSGRVLIEIVRPPEGDESHALDHVASDTKLLSNLRHRRLVPILGGRWVGDDAFAVIREYVDDPSVADLLARGDPFTNTRTAALLREVHGVLQWAREHDVVHRRVTTDRLFLEPTSDRVRVSFAAGPLQRVRATDQTTDDVVTVVRLAIAMLSGGIPADEAEGQTFAELRPDLPERLHEETERLLSEPATDHDLTLYLALIGMADPVAEGETERDRIRGEVLEEQRVEREKLANERAELARHVEEERRRLAEEGEELRAAFAQEKSKLEREFAASQRLLAAERAEMQRIIAAERAELVAKRDRLERELASRLAEVERVAAEDRAKLEALRERIREAGEEELERKRAAALEDLDDSEIRLNTGRYATPRFIEPKLAPFPGIAFHRDEHLATPEPIEGPTVDPEPWTVVQVVRKLREPRKTPIPWRRWAVRGGIAAAILITAGTAMVIESRSPDYGNSLGTHTAPSAATRPAGTATAPAVTPPTGTAAPTYATENGAVGATPATDTVAARVRRDSVARAGGDSATRARRDSVRRAMAALSAGGARADSTSLRGADAQATRRTQPVRRDDQDLMLLSDSLAGASGSSGGGSAPQNTGGP